MRTDPLSARACSELLETFTPEPGGSGLLVYLATADAAGGAPGASVAQAATPAELQRAARFLSPVDGARHLAAHHLLRRIIAHHWETAPLAINLTAGRNGRPEVAGLPFSFNLSRSGPLVAVAIAFAGTVGVDVEEAVPFAHCREAAPRALTATEWQWCLEAADEARATRFLQLWTLKEAVLKASGEGLLRDPRELELSLATATPALRRLPPGLGTPGDWKIGQCDTGGRAGALAYARRAMI